MGQYLPTVIPYIHGLGERFKRTCNNMGIQLHFKGTKTINPPHGPQGQGEQTTKEWSHLQI